MAASRANDHFEVARLAKALSPLLTVDALRAANEKRDQLREASAAIEELSKLWNDGADPTLLQVLRRIRKDNLLDIPESLRLVAIADDVANAPLVNSDGDVADSESERTIAITKFLEAPFSQVKPLSTYLAGEAHFDTHQGVKGLEFDRVMVIMDDAEARGFMFKYEDLFGGKAAGDKTVETTKRLFYVTCSRAKKKPRARRLHECNRRRSPICRKKSTVLGRRDCRSHLAWAVAIGELLRREQDRLCVEVRRLPVKQLHDRRIFAAFVVEIVELDAADVRQLLTDQYGECSRDRGKKMDDTDSPPRLRVDDALDG